MECMNPYLDRASLGEDIMQSFSKTIKSLSKDTEDDKQNKVSVFRSLCLGSILFFTIINYVICPYYIHLFQNMLKMHFFFQKKYKEEMGKYQLAIRSSKNKAALTDEKVRYKR